MFPLKTSSWLNIDQTFQNFRSIQYLFFGSSNLELVKAYRNWFLTNNIILIRWSREHELRTCSIIARLMKSFPWKRKESTQERIDSYSANLSLLVSVSSITRPILRLTSNFFSLSLLVHFFSFYFIKFHTSLFGGIS